MRIGLGTDIHAFADDRPLILGGVTIPYDRGLAGHSDADVLAHALTDALLGAAGLGDIGRHFPDTDPAYKGADSLVLLKEAYRLVRQAGYRLGNADCVIMAQAPKLAPYIDQMSRQLAGALDERPGQVHIKATTTEKLGFVGRQEGIAAQAVVLLTVDSE
ncbi:2-C-methyl-D-erythritol 2,4-cyclodiphosphate synthase [Peptococcus simiae]|uniref:2-C-methyl-D-erythritol 2,4-cyclodiphosphate synthase n=1 Tax=Peptococcus simiae TaxID=1643805 RepID=A0ABW9GYU8_9FIRM